MNTRRWFFILLFLGLPLASFAHTNSAQANLPTGPYVQTSFGVGWMKIGRTQNWALNGVIQNRYVDHSATDSVGVYGIQAGYGFAVQNKLLLQIGIGYNHTNNYKSRGYIQEDMDPTQQNLAYQYDIYNNQVMFISHLFVPITRRLFPYFSLGVGYAWVTAHNYSERSIQAGSLPGTPFNDHTQNNFSYEAGLSILFKPTKQLGMTLGYRYVDIGRASLGSMLYQTTKDRIQTDRIHVNAITLGLIYFFN